MRLQGGSNVRIMDGRDAGKNIWQSIKLVATLEKHLDDQRNDLAELKAQVTKLAEGLTALTYRVVALEEGRKTVDADVRRIMTEVIADWQKQHDARERDALRAEVEALKRGISGGK